jgi:hypothetical protein
MTIMLHGPWRTKLPDYWFAMPLNRTLPSLPSAPSTSGAHGHATDADALQSAAVIAARTKTTTQDALGTQTSRIPSATAPQHAFEPVPASTAHSALLQLVTKLMTSHQLDSNAARSFLEAQLSVLHAKAPEDVGTWLLGLAHTALNAQSQEEASALIEQELPQNSPEKSWLLQRGSSIEAREHFAMQAARSLSITNPA